MARSRSVLTAVLGFSAIVCLAGQPSAGLRRLEEILDPRLDAYRKGAVTPEDHASFVAQFHVDLDDAYSRARKSPENTGLYARILARLGDREREEAQTTVASALLVSPDNPELLVTQGHLYHEKGDYAEAARFARRAWEASGQRDRGALALLKTVEGRTRQGGGRGVRNLEPRSTASAATYESHNIKPANPQAMEYMRKAVDARRSGDGAASMRAAQEAMNADPTSTVVQEFYTTARADHERALATKKLIANAARALAEEDYAAAESFALRAHDLSPGDETRKVLDDVRRRSRRTPASGERLPGRDAGTSRGGSLGGVISMTADWVTGTGERHRTFGPGSPLVEDMRSAPMVEKAKRVFYEKNAGRNRADYRPLVNYKGSFGLRGLARAGLNPTQQFVGSYRIDIIPKEDGDIYIVIQNTTSMKSFLYGAGPSWSRETMQPFGNMSQTYQWSEPMK